MQYFVSVLGWRLCRLRWVSPWLQVSSHRQADSCTGLVSSLCSRWTEWSTTLTTRCWLRGPCTGAWPSTWVTILTWSVCPQSSVLGPRSSVLGPRSSVLGPRSSVLSPQSSVLGPQSLVLSPRSSVHPVTVKHTSTMELTHS